MIESLNEIQSVPSREGKSIDESAQHGETNEGCVGEAQKFW